MSNLKMKTHLTSTEAAALMGLSRETLTAYRNRGKGLPYIKQGGKIYYRQKDVIEYIKGKLIIPGGK